MIATRKRAQIQEEAKARDRRRRVAKGRFHDFVQTINPSLLQYEPVMLPLIPAAHISPPSRVAHSFLASVSSFVSL